MTERSYTPRDIFADILEDNEPQAVAWVRGDAAHPALSGMIKFYKTPYQGVLIEAEVFGLPDKGRPSQSNYYGFHIHENGNCSGTAASPFANAGSHYNPSKAPHPLHAGDFPPLLSNQGYAWMSFYDKRFSLQDILGRSVIIHNQPDDFTTQPSGNSGTMIGCGVIMKN